MYRLLLGATSLMFFTIVGISDAGALKPGDGYKASVRAACRDLTDEEIQDADDMPGNGYRDSKKAAEESQDVAMQQVFQDDEGTFFILDDDGEIHEV